MGTAVHRLVEQQVAGRGDATAVVGAATRVSYRDLNARANALARALIGVRFRRGAHAVVEIERSPELAIALLAVLKAGGAYSWREVHGAAVLRAEGLETIALAPLLSTPVVASPNLPILTRSEEPACLLPDAGGNLVVVVSHQMIVSGGPFGQHWSHDAGAFDLWSGLMSGGTVSAVEPVREAA